MAETTIRITNATNGNLSLVGDDGKPNVLIGSISSVTITNYIDLNMSDVKGNALLCETLSTWIAAGTVVVTKEGTVITSTQMDALLLELTNVSENSETWIIDPTLGNDTTGDGSVNKPFKSFHCLDDLPKTIEYEIKVKPKAGTYTYFPEVIDHDFFGDGKIIIDASGETYPVYAGPYTISTVSGVGSAYAGQATATEIEVAGETWTVDEYYPKCIHFLTGAAAGQVLPVWKNAADTLVTVINWHGILAGDTFNIVDCPVNITTSSTIEWLGNHKIGMIPSSLSNAEQSPHIPFYLFCGIQFTANSTSQVKSPFKLNGVHWISQFCTFYNSDNVSSTSSRDVMTILDSVVNKYITIASSTFDNSVLTVPKYAFYSHVNPVGPINKTYLSSKNADVSGIFCRGGISSFGDLAFTRYTYTISGQLLAGVLSFNHIEQIGYTDTCISITKNLSRLNSYVEINGTYIQKGGTPLEAYIGGKIVGEWFKGNTPQITSNYAAYLGNGVIFVKNSANVDILGSVGAYTFSFGSLTHAAWPTSGNVETDSAGSYVLTS